MKKNPYLPDNDALRLAWLINFNNKLVKTHAKTLGLTPAQLLYILTGLNMFSYILACVTAVDKFYHTVVSYKDSLNANIIGTTTQAIPVYTSPDGAPVLLTPSGFFGWITTLVANIKTNTAYTKEMGVDLAIIGSAKTIDWATAQPKKVKVSSNAGAVHGSFLKAQATGGRIECKRGVETIFTTVTNVSGAKFTDDRHNLVVGVPETRQYRIWYLLKDELAGVVSDIVTITVND